MRAPAVMRIAGTLAGAAAIVAFGSGCDAPTEKGRGGAGGEGGSVAVGGWPEVPAATAPQVLASGLDGPCGLAVGPDGFYVAEEGAGRIVTVPIEGGPASELVAGLAGPRHLALFGGDVFTSDAAAGEVLRVRGAAATVLASGQESPGRVRVDGNHAYWIVRGSGAADGAIRRVPRDGGLVEDLAAGLISPEGLALTADRAYFAERGAHRIGYAPLAGGDPVWLDDADGVPYDVAVDDVFGEVFWSSPGNRGGGWIHRTDLDLVGDERVSFSPPGPTWLWLGALDVVWSTSYTLARAARGGGAYQDIVAEASACDFVVVGVVACWTSPLTGEILAAALDW